MICALRFPSQYHPKVVLKAYPFVDRLLLPSEPLNSYGRVRRAHSAMRLPCDRFDFARNLIASASAPFAARSLYSAALPELVEVLVFKALLEGGTSARANGIDYVPSPARKALAPRHYGALGKLGKNEGDACGKAHAGMNQSGSIHFPKWGIKQPGRGDSVGACRGTTDHG